MNKRIICLLLCLSLVAAFPLTAMGEENQQELHIRSLEDFLAFAENCVLDSYSRNLTVYLDCDLDLSGIDFGGIPTFGGTFEGQNHCISGLEVRVKSSAVGLFRYVQPSGVVRDLTVSGQITPGGTAEMVGGIVGSNQGVLQRCHFEGSVAAKSMTGGIAGVNGKTGYLIDCTSRGVVVGENMTGGIVGYNISLVENCENHACVNIYTPDSSKDLGDIDLSILMDPTSLSAGITVMDTGGIAGYSIGAIYDCCNTASIGYPHIGYNVGGIVGRSSGTVSSCTNAAEIQGRKDVGGIVGQMEPNVSLNLSEDTLQLLQTQLSELKDLTAQLQVTFDQLGPVNTHLNNTLDYVDSASGSLEALAGHIGDYGTAITDEVNRMGLILDEIIDQMVPVLEQATNLSDSLASAMDRLADAMDALAETMDYLELSISLLNRATGELKQAGASASQAMELITQGAQQLAGNLQVEDPEQLQAAIEKIKTGLTQLSTAMGQTGTAMQKIADALQAGGTWDDDTAAAFGEITQALSTMAGGLQNIAEGMSLLSGSISFGDTDFWTGVDTIGKGMDALNGALESLQKAADVLSLSMTALGQTADLGGDALEILADSMEEFAGSFRILTDIGQQLEKILTSISNYEPIKLPYLDSGASESADALFASINSISDELRSILQISDQFSKEAKQQIGAITDKFEEVISTALQLVDQMKDSASDGLISDTSDVDIDAVKAGKVRLCTNYGTVCGDISVGGIAGAIAIEYQLDPEDDISAELSDWQTRIYQAKAIVQECTNLGTVSGKRSYMGGVCGKMDMGIILESTNFGTVSSSEGDYVGGIAGDAAGTIRQCAVKACISGGKYVGGVAGQGIRVTNCSAMVQLTGSEKTGAVLGYAEDMTAEDIAGNLYFAMPDAPGAIDGISYDGCAQASQPDAFLSLEGLDERFQWAVLTFCYEDGTTEILKLPVGTVLEQAMVPALSNTAQQIIYWKELETCLGKAQYFDRTFTVTQANMISVLESQQTRPNGMPVVLLQGSFCTSEPVQLEMLADMADALEGWRFTVPEDGVVSQIRYACPAGEDSGDLQILVLDSTGTYRSVPFTRNGSYLVFSVEEGTTHFYVTKETQRRIPTLYLVLSIVLLAGAAATVVVVRRSKKNRSIFRKKKGTTEQ